MEEMMHVIKDIRDRYNNGQYIDCFKARISVSTRIIKATHSSQKRKHEKEIVFKKLK